MRREDNSASMTLPTPTSFILVHGAGSGPWVYDGWSNNFQNIAVRAIDLQENLNIAAASMNDYADRIVTTINSARQPAAIVGWSMCGLVAMLAAQHVKLHSLVLIEPSPPAEIQRFDERVHSSLGTFDPETVYGAFPPTIRSRPESSLARSQRKMGVSAPSLPARTLVIYGDEFRVGRGEAIVHFYKADAKYFPGKSHWDLLLDPSVRAAISTFLGTGKTDMPFRRIQTKSDSV